MLRHLFSPPTRYQEPYLKEHVVGILFSRSKLTHLQRQVCLHIVQAIKKESSRMRDDWEVSLCSGAPAPATGDDLLSMPDTYCFEMLSLVLALSGSSVGRSYLASQFSLIVDLLTLLHTGELIGLLLLGLFACYGSTLFSYYHPCFREEHLV